MPDVITPAETAPSNPPVANPNFPEVRTDAGAREKWVRRIMIVIGGIFVGGLIAMLLSAFFLAC
jgi:hypothetical protein